MDQYASGWATAEGRYLNRLEGNCAPIAVADWQIHFASNLAIASAARTFCLRLMVTGGLVIQVRICDSGSSTVADDAPDAVDAVGRPMSCTRYYWVGRR